MSTEREELADLLCEDAAADRAKTGGRALLVPVVRAKAEAAADKILAAGYSKQSIELAQAMRGAKTLGEIIEKQCRDVLDVTGLHHLINADGDGHWDVVWMRLFEMRAELASLKESTIGRERLRGDSWRDRAQAMELVRDTAVERAEAAERLARKQKAALDALNDWCGRYKHGFYDEAQDDVGQILRHALEGKS